MKVRAAIRALEKARANISTPRLTNNGPVSTFPHHFNNALRDNVNRHRDQTALRSVLQHVFANRRDDSCDECDLPDAAAAVSRGLTRRIVDGKWLDAHKLPRLCNLHKLPLLRLSLSQRE